MNLPKKYYEELFFSSGDDRDLLPRNQDAIIELLDQNGAVGVVGIYEEPEYPVYFISGFALTAVGYSYEEMMSATGGRFLNLVFEKDRRSFAESIENRDALRHEFRMISSSGKNVWVNSFKKESVSIDGRPIMIMSIRVVENAKKRESELLDALTKGYRRIIYVDVNQGRYRIVKSEGSWPDEQVSGTVQELEELLRRYGRDHINPEDKSFAEVLNQLDFFSRSEEKGGTYQATYRAMVDGEYQWVQFQALYGGAMNLDTGHIILTFRGVDAEKRRELDSHQILSDSLAKAEEARRVKNEFLARMSHGLRTPINGITGMLEIARANRHDPEKISECLEKISLSCSNLTSLVQTVLDMNNLESPDVELPEEAVSLSAFLDRIMKRLANRAKDSGLSCRARFEGFAHENVICSPKHLQEIFYHILDNAIKYNKPGGSITVSARELSCNGEIATYMFSVADTGMGMSREFTKLVFKQYEQENSRAHARYTGAGLGMTIVKKLVDQMNGTVSLNSLPGMGTKVQFTLPFRVCEEAEEACAAEEGVDLSSMSALLVEDNELNMEITQFQLESAGMSVTCAVNGLEATDLFRHSEIGQFDVILMDIMMPVMDGLEAVKIIRGMDRPDAKRIPIIALSANAMDADVKKARVAGMDTHLAKPVDPEQLLEAVRRLIRS